MVKCKFAHIADCHIGGWREPKLHDAGAKAFSKSVDICLERKVDFVIIAGDLFNNAIPSIDNLKSAITELKRLYDNNIPVYAVGGSHDFSSSGKTIIDVLEKAGLLINLTKADVIENKLKLKFTIDPKTQVKLTGMIGKRGTLEKKYYEQLDYDIENEQGFKIFVFHTALTEFLPREMKEMEAMNVASLPRNFNYYAGGHVHYIYETNKDGMHIVYPGPIFPNNFAELEKLHNGSFYIIDVDDKNLETEMIPIVLYNYTSITIDCNNKNPVEINEELKKLIENKEFFNSIVTLRLHGVMSSGKFSEINTEEIIRSLYDKGAYVVLKSSSKLKLKENIQVKDINIDKASIEDELINANIHEQSSKILVKDIMRVLSNEKLDGEKKYDYEDRIIEDIKSIVMQNETKV